jgi:RHS repeat-associated protein
MSFVMAGEIDLSQSKGIEQEIIESFSPEVAGVLSKRKANIKIFFNEKLKEASTRNSIKLRYLGCEEEKKEKLQNRLNKNLQKCANHYGDNKRLRKACEQCYKHIYKHQIKRKCKPKRVHGVTNYNAKKNRLRFNPNQKLKFGYYEVTVKELKTQENQKLEKIVYRFEVSKNSIENIVLTPNEIMLNKSKNETVQLKLEALYKDGSTEEINEDINWVIGDETLLSISQDGNITALKQGETLVQAEYAGKVSEQVKVTIVEETLLTSVALTVENSVLEMGQTEELVVTAHYADNSSEEVLTNVEWIISEESIVNIENNRTLKALKSGTTTIQVKIGEVVSNEIEIEVKEPIVLQSISVRPNPVALRVDNSVQIEVYGEYSDGTKQLLDNVTYSLADESVASVESEGLLEALSEGSTTLTVRANALHTAVVNITITKELDTSNFDFTNFGTQYVNTIPVNATVESYDEKRFCMITGQILNEDGSPLKGVKVSILNHIEYGSTVTDSNGSYALPSEGGLQLTMRYQKDGFTTVDRKVQAPVQDWIRTETVTMLKLDMKVTQIDLTDETPQLHVSTPVTDDRGERSTTLVFDGVTKATVTAKDGSTRELTNLAVRATEFKTPDSMPSDLPINSAYTYCSDLTVDGVRDDENVTFDAPVVMYVENFLGFDFGEIVPIGYYDRNDGKWKASDNGVVVKLLDTDNDGEVDALDSTGDGEPNDLNDNGSFEDEVTGIVNDENYSVGKTYWRAEMTHFTPWDHNWPYGPPEDAVAPETLNVKEDSDEPNDCKVDVSSYVTSKSRVFHEDIPVAGTNITLHYASNRVNGYKYVIDASVNASELPNSVIGATVKMEVAGRLFTKDVNLGELNRLKFEWDGKDALGNSMTGEVEAKITTTYKYNLVYYSASSAFRQAWNQVGTASLNIIGREKVDYSSSRTVRLYVQSHINKNANLGNGWSLSNHDIALNNIIIKGNGVKKINQIFSKKIETIANFSSFPYGITTDNEGNLFVAETDRHRIQKVDPQGVITRVVSRDTIAYPAMLSSDDYGNLYINGTYSFFIQKLDSQGVVTRVAGSDYQGFSGDGGDATQAQLYRPHGIVIDNDGNLFIADTYNHRIRKVDNQGIITTVAHLTYPRMVTIDNNGNLYITSRNNHRVYKLDSRGVMTTVAGNGNAGFSGDGGDAIEAQLDSPNGIAVDDEGNLYIVDQNNRCIRKVDNLGTISTIVSDDEIDSTPSTITVDTYGNIYITDNFNIKKISISTLFQKYNLTSNYLLYKNQNNTADIFDNKGKHLKTIDLETGNSLKEFVYDEEERLINITDQFNQTLTIIRDSNGYPTQITAPNGQITNLVIDENGDLVEVKYEDNSKYSFTYFEGSLMDKMTDPNGNEVLHFFDENGRIIEEIDGVNGSYQFVNLNGVNDTTYKTIFPEGNEQSSKHTVLEDGTTAIEMTLSTGEKVNTTFSADEQNVESSRDGVLTKTAYGIDSLTQQQILKSRETTQPSGLKQLMSYTVAYDGNETHTNAKTMTTTSNGKTVTSLANYSAGTVTLTTAEGRVATQEYDVNTGLTSKVTSGTLLPTTYLYDAKGRVSSTSTGTRTVNYSYGSRGNVATMTDAKGEVTSFEYDIMDRVTKVTHPNGVTEQFVYDKNGNMTQYTTPRPSIYDFAFNGGNQRTAFTSPLNKSTSYTYNKNKRLTQVTKPSGKTIVNNYVNDRLESSVTAEGTTNYSYLFANKVGSISKGDESFSFAYDGDLLTKITQTGLLNHVTTYGYNNDFQITSNTYAGKTENYSYDNDGLMLTSGDYTLTRDAQNGYTTQVSDGTITQSRSYKGYGEISQVVDNLFTYELSQRDNAGAITQKTETLNGISTTYDYSYDNVGRLTEVKKDNVVVENYSYDNNGNRVSATVNGVTTEGSYTLDDQLQVYGDNTYRYDNDGYLTEKTTPDGRTTYTYGTLGELRKVVTPTQTIEYLHNANNQRVAKKVDGEITEKYLWANLTTLLAIYDKDDNLVQRFEYADNRMPIAMTMNGQKYYLHYNQVGTLKAVSDDSLNILKEIRYDTYGNILSDSNEALKVPFGFAGGLYDHDTQLTRFGYRDYDAYTGKWTAKDPIDFAGGDSNLYGYVLGDPVNFFDNKGLLPNIIKELFYPTPLGEGSDNISTLEELFGETPNLSRNKQTKKWKRLHSDSTLNSNKSSLDFWRKKSTKEIIDSLKKDGIEPLVVKDGKIMNGNTRTKVLEERGIDINDYQKDICK